VNRTPLYETHHGLGAKMVDFAGWEMPVYYSSIIAEHNAVRRSAGLFDIGHMGAIKVSGENSLPCLQWLLSNDASVLDEGSSQYSIILNMSGGVIDDIFVYRLPDHYLLVVNASNAIKDFEWLNKNKKEGSELSDLKENLTLLALQGPKSQEILQKICSLDLKTLGHHKITNALISRLPCLPAGTASLISRTGYTGEDGFELFFDKTKAATVWNELIKLGATPCGLGARDTLRLEAGMPLYGHEYNEGITPIEAGFPFAVKFNKGDFIGRDCLLRQLEEGLSKKLVGLNMKEQGIPRQGYKIYKDGNIIGYVTSGTMSPTLNIPVGMAYVRVEFSDIGTAVDVEIREKMVKAEVVKLPFYKRK